MKVNFSAPLLRMCHREMKTHCPCKNVHTKGHSSITCNSQTVEVTARQLMNCKNAVYSHNAILCGHKKERNANTCYNMEVNSVHMKYPELGDLQRSKTVAA